MDKEGIWSVFCNNSECFQESGNCSSRFLRLINPNSCLNHSLILSIDTLLLLILLRFFITKSCRRKISTPSFTPLLVFSTSFISGLGLCYFGLGLWTMYKRFNSNQPMIPIHGWIVLLAQGLTWVLLGLSIPIMNLHRSYIKTVKFCAVLTFLFAGFLSVSSVYQAIGDGKASVIVVLEALCLPGSILLLFHSFRGERWTDVDMEITGYELLSGERIDQPTDDRAYYILLEGGEGDSRNEFDSSYEKVSPFENAKWFSTMSFGWLNPLMKKGQKRFLVEEDIPDLRNADKAEACYSMYRDELTVKKQKESYTTSTLLSILLVSHWRSLLISGFFAFIKIIALATGPLFLKAFIHVAEGHERFKHEGYALSIGLFIAKCLESVSERQWFFRTKLVGLQVKSTLSAAIYKKQLRLSNAAKLTHSPGQIVNYVTVDASRIAEFPSWVHQLWTSSLQLFLALAIVYYSLGLATCSALLAVVISVLGSSPFVKLQHKYQTRLMTARDERLVAITEALSNMKILKLYAWETHFKSVIETLRREEFKWLYQVLLQRGYTVVLFWSSPILVSAVTFWSCYIMGIELNAANVFTFLASLRILQEPIRMIPEVAGVFIEAKVSFSRIVTFFDAPELENRHVKEDRNDPDINQSIFIRATEISWETDRYVKPTLKNIKLIVKPGEKVAICGEVGSGKSTLLASVLGEVPRVNGAVKVYGKVAYVSQAAWIQTGSIRENILFGTKFDRIKYQQVLQTCCLAKDLDTFPYGDQTGIGERGINLSGGQKQRIQLARALYQDADIYLLDDPFSAVDAHTATSLFNDYVMGALSSKTVVLVTHQVDFLPGFDSVLLMSGGEIIKAAKYDELLSFCPEFLDLVNAHNNAIGSEKLTGHKTHGTTNGKPSKDSDVKEKSEAPKGDQLIKQEERETGNTGFKPYFQYLKQNKGFLYFSLAGIFHLIFITGQMTQGYFLAVSLDNDRVSRVQMITIFSVIGCVLAVFLLVRSFLSVLLGCGASEATFSRLLSSLFRAPMAFYDSTPLGRILSRVSSDLSVVDLEMAFKLVIGVGMTMNAYSSFIILGVLAWPVLFVIVPMISLSILLQRYYTRSAKELMRIGGTTKSAVASQLAESITGAMTIRAFGEEERFFSKYLNLIDANAKPDFHSFSANEWLIQRLELLCAVVLSSSALAMTLIPLGSSSSGFVGMALSYGLSLNTFLVSSIQIQCTLANLVISVERLEQYMHIPTEAPETIESNQPMPSWPSVGKVEIYNLKVRYRPNAPLVLKGITCTIEGGHKIGIVGRTGSGKSSLIASLFRLVEPTSGQIFIDDVNIFTIGIHDLRSRLGIIPQDPTLFSGSVRYNLDPLSTHTDKEIWEVLDKCQLREAVREKEGGLDALVVQDGTNWSMGQRQLFCLGRALLKRCRILVLDEATASMDNATDFILQKTIKTEFEACTVITVAHRIPTVMDCNMVLAISDGKIVEYDEPSKLMNKESSLFGQLVNEYWSHSTN